MNGAMAVVFENDDLLTLILAGTALTPAELVAVGRVSEQWRRAVHASAPALVRAATPPVMTKTVLMGLYGLSSGEADTLPRSVRYRRDGGCIYLYSDVAEGAWTLVGGAGEWRARLARRSAYQASVERSFGPEWRRLRWLPYQRPAAYTRPARSAHIACY